LKRGLFMKKTLKKIAMIFILVMLCNMFSGCLLYTVYVVADSVQSVGEAYEKAKEIEKRGPRRTNPYSYENSKFAATMGSLPEGDISFPREAFQSLPENETVSPADIVRGNQ
jgi:hypothetical protein